ncbi:hypothetical protein PPL_01299 [Heterostelium album PN500]|uniref:Bms1-type G domain-containing protein n=1 Tax=Heterostelium pallidum (strain ATCC 26659 / Pp 5 / PN500) TaxID=670386 RepID=D3AYN6_HETP5|nr:hypothetical protein PPL_01299 [Heterostelium album PN500]EFA86063.1 hypothetical protein PPL_01299 [Heterostelium album PN500]|eukprot:XP_020438169.1 hypothetical protein PPL_01299 [Heterostelium album PN500]
MEHRHRSGPLKQQNKSFKAGRHDSKGTIKRRAAGKVETNSGVRQSVKASAVVNSRQHEMRQKQLKQSQSKRAESIERARLGLPELAAPRIVCIISLSEGVNMNKLKSNLLSKFELSAEEQSAFLNTVCLTSKVRASVMACDFREVNRLMDYIKLADIVLFAIDAQTFTGTLDQVAERTCSVIKAQGVPSSMLLLQNLDKVPQKKKNDLKKQITTLYHFHFPEEPKVLAADTPEEHAQILRFVESMHINDIQWRNYRPYLLVEKMENDVSGNLVVTGFVRGNNMSAKQVVHLPGVGDFQIAKIEEGCDPHETKYKRAKAAGQTMAMDTELKILDQSTPEERDTLQTHNIPDYNEQEQTMPTNEEIAMAANRKKVLVPKGTSSYQASWYLDEEGEGDDGEGFMDDEMMENAADEDGMAEGDEEEETAAQEAGEEEELEELELNQDKWKGKTKEDIEKIKEQEEQDDMKDGDDDDDDESEDEVDEKDREQNEFEFPDEVQTPENFPCRVRYSKYRGLKSFRSSPWDAMENLPIDYARIFQFHSFNQSMKASIAIQDKAPVKPDTYVRITLVNGPITTAPPVLREPMILSGLMRYENKVSVLHFAVEKHRSHDDVIKSKEEVFFHIGFRKYSANPIYSISAPNCDKQKYEPYLFAGRNSVATIFAPITFPPAPLLVFRDSSCEQLVATGHLLSVNPDRIICKRIILTGRIAKALSRKFVTIRDMFYYPEDIEWFKKIELYTKYGRVGHIKESLGTHGRMKCLFDGKMDQSDTVCLNLYKRVYPKWVLPLSEEELQAQQQQKQQIQNDMEN